MAAYTNVAGLSTSDQLYADPEGLRKYEDFDGEEVIAQQLLLNISVNDALDLWMKYCWECVDAPLQPTLLPDNVTRVFPYVNVREKLLNVSKATSNSNVASILYKVVSCLGMQEHLGWVTFVPAANEKTLVVWQAKFVPTQLASIFCCGGTVMRAGIRSYFQKVLRELCEKI